MPDQSMRVAICITTFRRPNLLQELLEGLSRLTFAKVPLPGVDIIVVDNDPLGSAREVCRAADLPFALKYVIEPRRGIAQARNRAVAEAGEAPFIAFIDDDEVPLPNWLDELLWTQSTFKADVVAGPVPPRFHADTPQWVKTGGFFDRAEFETGTPIENCGAGNVLVSRGVFMSVPTFDEQFQLTGGEDTHFFMRVRRAGNSIVHSKEAVAYESIPEGRTKLAWILRRGYQSGNCWARCECSLDGRFSVRAVRFVKALGYIVKGALGAVFLLPMGRAALARSLQSICVGAGMFSGMAGQKYLAYQGANPEAQRTVEVCSDQAPS